MLIAASQTRRDSLEAGDRGRHAVNETSCWLNTDPAPVVFGAFFSSSPKRIHACVLTSHHRVDVCTFRVTSSVLSCQHRNRTGTGTDLCASSPPCDTVALARTYAPSQGKDAEQPHSQPLNCEHGEDARGEEGWSTGACPSARKFSTMAWV